MIVTPILALPGRDGPVAAAAIANSGGFESLFSQAAPAETALADGGGEDAVAQAFGELSPLPSGTLPDPSAPEAAVMGALDADAGPDGPRGPFPAATAESPKAPALQDQPAEDPAPLPPSGSGHILADAPEAAFPSPPLPEPAPQRAEDPPSATLAILRPAAEALAASAARLPADAELVMELTLDTEGIGPIRFIMETAGDVIRVHLVAQQADVLDLLRHHAADLIAGLQEAGYREAQMSFGAWQRPPPSPLPPTDAADTTEAALVAPPVAMVAACRGGLDIRW